MAEQTVVQNRLVWVDIPVADLDRAIAFYAAVLAVPVEKQTHDKMSFAVIEHHEPGNGGCLVPDPEKITQSGPLVYFSADGRIRDAVKQVEARGGKILEPTHPIGPFGFRAVVLDSEGNRIALHSPTDK